MYYVMTDNLTLSLNSHNSLTVFVTLSSAVGSSIQLMLSPISEYKNKNAKIYIYIRSTSQLMLNAVN